MAVRNAEIDAGAPIGNECGRGMVCATPGHMVAYAIIPRRRSYRIEAIDEDGKRRVVGCFSNEEAALRRLHELQKQQEVKERRRVTQEVSRWCAVRTVGTQAGDPDL